MAVVRVDVSHTCTGYERRTRSTVYTLCLRYPLSRARSSVSWQTQWTPTVMNRTRMREDPHVNLYMSRSHACAGRDARVVSWRGVRRGVSVADAVSGVRACVLQPVSS